MKKSLWLAISFYLISLVILSVYLWMEIHPRIVPTPTGRLLLLSVFCLLTFVGSRWLAHHSRNVMKYTLWVYFALYLSLLVNFTLLDAMFGRMGRWIFSDSTLLSIYWNRSVNFIPFATIVEYVNAFFNHTQSFSAIVTNLFGNFVALMPMALFLPLLIKGCRKVLPFLLVTSGVVVIIELLQFVFAVGSCDIDDWSLNISGAMLAFWLLRRQPVKRLLHKLLLIDHE